MATISPSVGLVSGLNLQDMVTAIVSSQQAGVQQLQSQETGIKQVQSGLDTLSANLLSLSTSAQQLSNTTNFQTFTATSSDPQQLSVTTSNGALAGSYQFQVLRLASNEQIISRGFVNSDQQTVGTGTLTLSSGGRLQSDTPLDTLNGGAGVRRGTIRITDRSGASALVDLSATSTITDVVNAINANTSISVTARTRGDKLVLTDATGQSLSNLTVSDVNAGKTAQDLGLVQSVAGQTLTGSAIYQVTGAFTLSRLNDGNGVRVAQNLPSIRIQLTDPAATTLDVDLNGALTLNDVLSRINGAAGNNGKVGATISGGRLVLQDTTGGGGAQSLTVTDLNGSSVVHALGLDATAAGNVLTSTSLTGGLNSVLLRNLRGGQGIDQLGSIALTDRAGTTATVDLSQASSLDDVLNAINTATDANGTRLKLSAAVDANGTGLQITDTSGATASNLIISDVGGGTAAAQLKIAVNGAQSSIDSGSLALRYVSEATSLSTYAAGGQAVHSGSFVIVDSSGQQTSVIVPDQAKNIGDVLLRINAASNGRVTAQLNSAGDGIELVDNAGGNAALQVKEAGSTTAANLHLLGTGVTQTDGKSHIVGRSSTQVSITATDTLQTVVSKLNSANAGFTAAIVDDGSSFSPKRLVLTATQPGAAGRLVFDDGGLGLGLTEQTRGTNALVRIGADQASGFIVSSSTNHFAQIVPGLDVDATNVGTTAAQVRVTQDTSRISSALNTFVNNYNNYVTKVGSLTKFDTTSNTGGVLQGEGIALRISSALSDVVGGNNYGSKATSTIRSLADLGISFQNDGTLTFDSTKLSSALASHPDSVSDFFLATTSGFGTRLKSTITSFTDPTTGQLAKQSTALQDSINLIEGRVTSLNDQIDARKQTLLLQFYNMETVLSSLQAQQSALTQFQNLLNNTTTTTAPRSTTTK